MSNSSLRLALSGSLLLAIGLALVPAIGSQGPRDAESRPERSGLEPLRASAQAGPRKRPEASVPPVAPEVSPELRAQLDALRRSHRREHPSMARIRLEGTLDRLWRDDVPLDLLIHETADEGAPVSYRLHMARRLGNVAKSGGAAERENLSASLRRIMDRPGTSPEARVGLASVLATMDGSAETVRSVAMVVEEAPGDEMRAGAIAALCQIGGEGPAGEVWRLVQGWASDPGPNPRALVAAIPPLARRPDYPVETILQPIVADTTDVALLVTALQAVALRAPAPESVGILVAAWQRAGEFPTREETRIRSACRHVLHRLAPRLHADPSLVPASAAEELKAIKDPHHNN